MQRIFSHWKLMISLLFLGVTALLSFNEPTDLRNTYETLNEGLLSSNRMLDSINQILKFECEYQANRYLNSEAITNLNRVYLAIQYSGKLNNYIDSAITDIEFAKNNYVKEKGDLIYNLTKNERLLKIIFKEEKLNLNYFLNALEVKLINAISELKSIKDEEVASGHIYYSNYFVGNNIDSLGKNIIKTFYNLSINEVIMLLNRIKVEIKSYLYYILFNINTYGFAMYCGFDQYKLAIVPQIGFINEGQLFSAEFFLSKFNSYPRSSATLTANSINLKLKEGVASYSDLPKDYGIHNLLLNANFINPYNGKNEELKYSFSYEVLDRSIFVNSDKVKALYIGIDNPINISLPRVKSEDLIVQISGYGNGKLVKVSNTNYIIQVNEETNPGEFCEIKIMAKGVSKRILFKVKRIPDPVIHIDKAQNDEIDHNYFKANKVKLTYLGNYNLFDSCKLKGFTISKLSSLGQIEREVNVGSNYNTKCQGMVNNCKEGDIYYYSEIKANCPGDRFDRILDPLVLTIK